VNPTLVLDLGHALYVGPLGELPEHRASASALLVGMERPFDLTIADNTVSQRFACVTSQTLHGLDGHGARMAVFYFDPGTALRNPPAELSELICAIDLALQPERFDAWHELLAMVQVSTLPSKPEPRLAAIAHRLIQSPDEAPAASELAASAQLSVSRLEHLFKTQFGVPLRAFRTWYRFRLAARQLLKGSSITDAAHAAGFHDSAHFSRAFGDTFGLPPSHVFTTHLRGHFWD
jgi:AraC-like DNA-binding protein